VRGGVPQNGGWDFGGNHASTLRLPATPPHVFALFRATGARAFPAYPSRWRNACCGVRFFVMVVPVVGSNAFVLDARRWRRAAAAGGAGWMVLSRADWCCFQWTTAGPAPWYGVGDWNNEHSLFDVIMVWTRWRVVALTWRTAILTRHPSFLGLAAYVLLPHCCSMLFFASFCRFRRCCPGSLPTLYSMALLRTGASYGTDWR